jgi:crossover junction endodeoxyribonuclease RusA
VIVLTLPYPPSANRYWATRVVSIKGRPMPLVYVTADAKDFKVAVAKACSAAGVVQPLLGRVAIHVQLYPHRPLDHAKRMRQLGPAWDDGVQCLDLDNANKVLLDSLKGVAIEDDKWVRLLSSERMEPDGEARVVVRVNRLTVETRQADLLGAAA